MKTDFPHVYAIALGSNQALSRYLTPPAILYAALERLNQPPFRLLAASDVIASRPIGPSRRSYANGVALIESSLAPRAALAALQAIERDFGRKRARRWGARRLDLDIILWSGGRVCHGRHLIIPHPQWTKRAFVTAPLVRIASRWRDPHTGRTVAAQFALLVRPKPVDRLPTRL